MTKTIEITAGANNFILSLNFARGRHAILKGLEIKSDVTGKLISMQSPDLSHLGKNVGETYTVGTKSQVVDKTHDITDDTADTLIASGFAKEVI